MFNSIKTKIKRRIYDFIVYNYEPKMYETILDNLAYSTKINEKKNKVLYTCLTGGYDTLPLHEYINYDWDYICFTDNEHLLNMGHFGAWKIRPLFFHDLDNQLNNRWHKTHPHVLFPHYTESIYIDSNISVLTDYCFNKINELNKNIVIPKHYEKDCIYEELVFVMQTIVKQGKEKAENVLKMKAFLEEKKFPHHYGLNENNFIYRRHNEAQIIKMMEEWWTLITNYTRRDQLSLAYVFWKNNIKPDEIAITNIRKDTTNYRMYLHK